MKYNLLVRILIIFPLVVLMSIVWGIIGIFDIESMGKVLKETGENFIKDQP